MPAAAREEERESSAENSEGMQTDGKVPLRGARKKSANSTVARGREPSLRRRSSTEPRSASSTKKKDKASPAGTGTRRAATVAVVVAVVVAVAAVVWNPQVGGGARHAAAPCACAKEAFDHAAPGSPQRLLAGSLSTRRASAISGVHARATSSSTVLAALSFANTCATVQTVAGSFTDVVALQRALSAPLQKEAKCVVWVVEESTVTKVAGALKELLEDNKLRGNPVVPPGRRAMMVLVSPKTREQLKESFPHRVVHMFTTVEFG